MKTAIVLALLAATAAASPGKPLKNNQGSTNDSLRRRPVPNRWVQDRYSTNWAGAVQSGRNFTHVEGIITVPDLSGASGNAVSMWVGIDGDACQRALLQTGLSFQTDGSFDAWYEWIPDYSTDYDGFQMRVGDQVKMIINATGDSTGVAALENLATGQMVTHHYDSSPSTLCQDSAEWIVEAYMDDGSEVVLADFGEVTITGVSATESAGTVNARGATIIDMINGRDQIIASCSAGDSYVQCKYTGSQ
ncbi:Concanavalin A-like lectin/glucanase [Metarhizium album ARSEF 1941]|uniref:Concanavalin A-like lectin/glucanase n=1 Tax=Metarhizium album (strain ARSEF 1941) TaxID=1081103 RepID=A0A0B2WRP8_METAS|nr:Concanavalin A-like lectin/glucanase [Metarhizium album ARSEF 1941]KHN95660.1 Concanavalin A-like lectin/glucanase [Metarhizium album ARSEF 1941]